jgi:hypothetical protein
MLVVYLPFYTGCRGRTPVNTGKGAKIMSCPPKYRPTATDLRWARGIPRPLKDRGVLVFPSSGLAYAFDRQARTLTLLNPDPAFAELHHRTQVVFGEIGYRVFPEKLTGPR